jgi:hypothetical protein
MAELQAVSAEIELLQRVYAAFNRREIETVLATMHGNVDWPNGMEGGRVLGKAAVRDYWTRRSKCLIPAWNRRVLQRKRTDGSLWMCIRWFTTRVENSWWIRWFGMCTKSGTV